MFPCLNQDSNTVEGSCLSSQTVFKDSNFYFFVLLTVIVLTLASVITAKSVKSSFYEDIKKPTWAPPPAFISTVWIILYFLIAYSTYRAYYFSDNKQRVIIMWLFLTQMSLNFAWVFVFFGLQNIYAARTVIFLLLAAIILQLLYMYSIDHTSGSIFLPYLIWVLIATILNCQIVTLNKQ
jgi:tryptophan-rich sensory protein